MSDLNVYTTSQINALTPITGDMVVDSDLNAVKLYDGYAWRTWNSDSTAVPYENRWGMDTGRLDVGTSTDFTFSTNGFTISMWFKSNKTTGIQSAIFDFRPGTATAPMLWMTSSQFKFHNGSYQGTPTYTPSLNWRHLVVTNDGSQTSIYLDDLTTALDTRSDTVDYGSNNLTIGSHNNNTSSGNFFPGIIDEVSIFNSTSSLSSVADLASGGKPADLSSYDPVAWYRMGDDSSDSPVDAGNITGITDSSGNGNDATQITASIQPTFSALASSETIYS